VFWYTRKRGRDPRVVLNLGLVYLVLTSLALAAVMHLQKVPGDFPIFPIISWIGAAVLMFAAIVPSTPVKTLLASLIAVSMNPLAMLLARKRGLWPFEAASNALLMHWPDFLMVGVAVVIAHVVRRLGQQVAKAREMGSYRLGELLGTGGMGEVYKATHRMLSRPAAIKVIRPAMLGGADGKADVSLAVKRFWREAEAAATLRSPHTVELYDFGITEDQRLYFVMEYLEGMTLDVLVRRNGPVPAPRTIHILRQVCESLAEAHSRGLVHRDIKPANIHVGRLGLQHDFVKVLDFGLVKPVTSGNMSDSDDHSLATAAGLTPGTPAYMAPESALGADVDGRADLYALGCVAYYLLTAQQVFDAVTPVQMIARHLTSEPIPPSRRTSQPIPRRLEEIVLSCLAKKPEDRPPTAEVLAEQLDGVQVERWSGAHAMEWWKLAGATR
jgi:serine/threonine-protein kinase